METNYPSIYLGQPVDFYFPPEISFEQLNAEQQASYTYWKQYATKHHIAYDYDETLQIISNFRATEREYELSDKVLVDMVTHVKEKRSGTKMRFFYLIIATFSYLFLTFKEHLFSSNNHIGAGISALICLVFLGMRYKHYYMHPDVIIVARVLILNEQKQKVWQLKHFSDKYWQNLKNLEIPNA